MKAFRKNPELDSLYPRPPQKASPQHLIKPGQYRKAEDFILQVNDIKANGMLGPSRESLLDEQARQLEAVVESLRDLGESGSSIVFLAALAAGTTPNRATQNRLLSLIMFESDIPSEHLALLKEYSDNLTSVRENSGVLEDYAFGYFQNTGNFLDIIQERENLLENCSLLKIIFLGVAIGAAPRPDYQAPHLKQLRQEFVE